MGLCLELTSYAYPASSVRLLLLQEAHGEGLMGHFGAKKTEDILADLKPYLGEEHELESRTTQIQEREDDEDINTHQLVLLLMLVPVNSTFK